MILTLVVVVGLIALFFVGCALRRIVGDLLEGFSAPFCGRPSWADIWDSATWGFEDGLNLLKSKIRF
jgi:hypothetical protein